MFETPDQINAKPGGPFYRCRKCRTAKGLSWYRGTSCPVCSDPECIAFCNQEWRRAMEQEDDDDLYY